MTPVLVLLAFVIAIITALVLFASVTARRIEAAIPPPGRFIDVNGVRLHYVDEGKGPVILLIHGIASQLQTFTFGVSKLLPGYRLVMLDRPGSGYSNAGPSASFKAQADLVAGFLRALHIEKPLIVGHSLGGAISLVLAVEHPDIGAGLALISPASQPQNEPPEALSGLAIRSDLMRRIIGWTLSVPISMRKGPQTMESLFGPDPVPADFGTRGGGLLPLRPWTFRHASRDLEAADKDLGTYAARHHEITMPVGVLYGTGDRILDYKLHGERLRAALPGIDIELLDQGGHMVPLSAPDRTAAFIRRMADKVGLGTAGPTAEDQNA